MVRGETDVVGNNLPGARNDDPEVGTRGWANNHRQLPYISGYFAISDDPTNAHPCAYVRTV